MNREADTSRFYSILERLEDQLGGKRMLCACSGRMNWPRRGVYFFFENGEKRSDSGIGPRVVRVGTHALTEGSGTTLWNRLSQHQGVLRTGGGNHRGSIFRLIVGTALIGHEEGDSPATWGRGNTADRGSRERELEHEKRVSRVIRAMPFLWLAIDDEPGPNSLRGLIERNTIALLSNYGRVPLDAPSPSWLGRFWDRERVRGSGLWNQNHVEEDYDRGFLDVFERLVDARQP
jgi:hypothetical protein